MIKGVHRDQDRHLPKRSAPELVMGDVAYRVPYLRTHLTNHKI